MVTYSKTETMLTRIFFQEMMQFSLAFNKPYTTLLNPRTFGCIAPFLNCCAHWYEGWGWDDWNTSSVLALLSLNIFTHKHFTDVGSTRKVLGTASAPPQLTPNTRG